MSVLHDNDAVSRRMSGAVWGKFPWDKYAADPTVATFKFCDFTDLYLGAALSSGGKIISDGCYLTAVTTVSGTEMAASTAYANGAILVTNHGGDNDENYLGMGDATAGPLKFTLTTGKKLWAECAVYPSALGDSFCFGIAKPALIAAGTLTDNTGVPAADDLFVLSSNYTAGKTIVTAYSKQGALTTTSYTISAATWLKLGVYYDGVNKMKFYADGTLVCDATVTSSDCTDNAYLTALFGSINDATSAGNTYAIDWMAMAAER